MALPSYKEIIELIKVGSTLEAQEKIIELRSAALESEEENLTLRKRVKALEAELALKDELQWEKPYYWRHVDGKKDGPYCQTCYDNNHKLIRLQGGASGAWYCQTCKGRFHDASYKTPGVSVSRSGSWKVV